ncbi:SBBP repeat-containing protein, partial [Pedosphaera parvula]
FNNTCTLGAFTLINPNPAALKLTPFVAKYDSAGNVLRAQMLSTNSVYLAAMALDSFNNLYLTGRFYATANFSGISLVSTNSSNGTSFLAKYDPNGNIQWIQLVSGTTHAIAVDEAGNGFLTGGFSGRVATFGSLSVTNSSLLGTYVNMFVAKFDNAGNWLWASQGGGSGSLADCYGTSLAVDTDGNCYVCGDYNHSFATFGSVTLPALSVFSNGFLAKYNSAGAALWAIRLGGSGPDGLASANEFNSLALDCVGNVFISGQSSSTNVSLGSITLTNTNAYNLQTNAHNLSIFAAKFDSSGNALWAKQALGAYTGEFSGISVDAYDNVYLLGSFDGQGIFDALTLNSPNKPWFFISRINGPELSLCSANSQMLVAWPTNAVGLHLESTGDLNANAWSAMPNEPTVIGTQNTVTVSASGSSQFFRLSGP